MANTIKIKNSGTAANVPSAASLQYGELALNYADGKLYFKTGASTVDFLKSNITLGTDTTGNYMSNVAAGTGISVSHTPAEGSTATVSLASGYGDTLNPYASKTANFVLSAPNGSAGVPTFRAIVAADIPTLNQNTTGSAATVTGAAQTAITSVGTLTSLTSSGNIGWSASTYLTPVTGGTTNYGSVKVTGTPTSSGWSGYSINGDAVFMSQANYFGLYDNINLEWGILCTRNGTTEIYHNGITRLSTQANGVNVTSPAPTISIGGWSASSGFSAIEASGYGYLLLGTAADPNTYLRSNGVVRIGVPSNNTLTVGATDITITGSMALSASTNAYVSYANTPDTAMPWMQGPTFQGQTGWAFYSSVLGGYRMGFRSSSNGATRYLWTADKCLLGSVPNDSLMNDTVNVIGSSIWVQSMPASTGATVVNNFGYLRYVSSRRELKDNIVNVELSDGLDRILALRPVEFTMKPEYLADANEYTPFDVKRGFIAQETAEVDHRYGQWGWVDENQMMATTPAINGELPLEEATPIYWNHDAVIADLVASIQNINTRLQQLETV